MSTETNLIDFYKQIPSEQTIRSRHENNCGRRNSCWGRTSAAEGTQEEHTTRVVVINAAAKIKTIELCRCHRQMDSGRRRTRQNGGRVLRMFWLRSLSVCLLFFKSIRQRRRANHRSHSDADHLNALLVNTIRLFNSWSLPSFSSSFGHTFVSV